MNPLDTLRIRWQLVPPDARRTRRAGIMRFGQAIVQVGATAPQSPPGAGIRHSPPSGRRSRRTTAATTTHYHRRHRHTGGGSVARAVGPGGGHERSVDCHECRHPHRCSRADLLACWLQSRPPHLTSRPSGEHCLRHSHVCTWVGWHRFATARLTPPATQASTRMRVTISADEPAAARALRSWQALASPAAASGEHSCCHSSRRTPQWSSIESRGQRSCHSAKCPGLLWTALPALRELQMSL